MTMQLINWSALQLVYLEQYWITNVSGEYQTNFIFLRQNKLANLLRGDVEQLDIGIFRFQSIVDIIGFLLR